MIQWAGDDPNAVVSVADYIADSPETWDEEDFEEADAFITGFQWDTNVLEQRERDGRVSLVINRLTAIAAGCRSVSAQRGEKVSQRQADRLTIAIYRNNRDAQRLYNYEASAQAEARSLKVKK